MKILFILSRPPETETMFIIARNLAAGGEELYFLLLEEACECTSNAGVMQSMGVGKSIFVLKNGPSGVSRNLAEGVSSIDYDGWVGLLELCDKVVSWG